MYHSDRVIDAIVANDVATKARVGEPSRVAAGV
jgi:hypothetical protein